MKSLAILGAGGHGKVVADAALCSGCWDDIVFYDNKWPEVTLNGVWKIVGNTDAFFSDISSYAGVIIAIGDNLERLKKIRTTQELNGNLATIIHPAATVSRFSKIGQASVIFAGAIVNSDCNIGIGAIINTGSTIDHDCEIGDTVHISPGAHLAGAVHVGDLTWVGIGSSIRQGIIIGAKTTIGAGAVVVKNIPEGSTAFGVPAEIISK